MPPLTEEHRRVLSDLRKVRRLLDHHEGRRQELYDRRLDLYAQARWMTPPIGWTTLAEASGTSDANVIQQFRRHTASGG